MSDLESMDWKRDKEFQAVQRKLSDLSERAEQIITRIAKLKETIERAEQQRIQVRANILLGEAVDSDAASLEESLVQNRRQLHDLEGDHAATTLAISKLQTALLQAETAAKKQVGKQLANAYRELVASLEESLNVAIEKNEEVQRLHRLASKQDLLAALAGDPAQKILLKCVALNFLNRVTLKEWQTLATPILQG